MDFETVRPIVSGLAGAALAAWLCHALSRWVPTVCNGKSAPQLVRENRAAIYLSNACFACGLIGAIAVYKLGHAASNDWRIAAVGFGAGAVAPVLVLPLSAATAGRAPKEALVAYAIAQKIPTALLYAIFAFGSACLAAGLAGLAGL
jgi:hypothetical protein